MSRYPRYEWVDTPKSKPADIDGLIVWDGTIISAVEVKCRNMTMDTLFNQYGGEWLVTSDKIDRGVAISSSLGVDFRGFLYLVPDNRLLIIKIWEHGKGIVCKLRKETTKTQATVNGGTIERVNAYIDMTNAISVQESRDLL